MSLKTLKWLTVLLPPFIIGGFEYVRHRFLLQVLTMEAGNVYITLIALVLSFLFATWMFRKIERINRRLAEEQSRRAVYEERERFAQELHDDIAQILFFLNVKLKQGKTEEARSAVAEIDNQLRQAIFNLRTPPSEGTSFTARISAWLQEWSAMTGIRVDLRLDVPDGFFRVAQELQLFGVIQEACTNIRKHSRASRAAVTLEPLEPERPGNGHGKRGWRLSVKDNGIGMPDFLTEPAGYGLTLLNKRARGLQAVLKVLSPPEGGTEIEMVGKG